jgi:hypothetical protein
MTNEDQSTHSPRPPVTDGDLSKSIDTSIERQPGEQVRSVRLFGDLYRCNWWTSAGTDWIGVTTGRIRRSKLLRVVMGAAGLVIEEVP